MGFVDPSIAVLVAGIVGAVLGALYVWKAPRFSGRSRPTIAALEILIVGHDDAGKTSFINFLRHHQFADERLTRDTLVVSQEGGFKVARPDGIDLPVKRIWDIPGPLDPEAQLDLVRRKPPKFLVIMVSTDNPSSTQWLRSFVTGLSDLLSKEAHVAGKLIGISVVLNKVDLITEFARGGLLEKMIAIVDSALEPLLGSNVRSITVLPCTLLAGKGGEKAANRILANIVNAAKKNTRLVPK